MSSALWHFFWTEADWIPGASIPPVVVIPPFTSAGGGHRRERFKKYNTLGDDFWLARERYLNRMQRVEVVLPQPPPTHNELIEGPPVQPPDYAAMAVKRDFLLHEARAANTRDALQKLGSEVALLSARLNVARRDEEDLAYILAIVL